jgi:hypothetical protein
VNEFTIIDAVDGSNTCKVGSAIFSFLNSIVALHGSTFVPKEDRKGTEKEEHADGDCATTFLDPRTVGLGGHLLKRVSDVFHGVVLL